MMGFDCLVNRNGIFLAVIVLFFGSGVSAADVAKDTTLPLPLVNFFVSNNGLNTNNGTSDVSPKRSIDSVNNLIKATSQVANPVAVSLETNSIFREEFQPVNNLQLTSFEKTPGGRRPKITGMDVVRNWDLTPGKTNVYQHVLTHSIDLDNPAYSYIIIAEIDTILEKTNPVAAVKYLRLTSGIDACENQPGTYYCADLKTNPITVYIHSSQGVPAQNKFRYEAATRRFSVNGFYYDDASYKNLFLQSSGNGYGMLSGGDRTLARNITFQGGGTHHFVIKSGTVDSCLFLPGPQGLANRIAGVFYEAEGKDNVNRLSNSIFLNIPTPIYTHTNGAVNHRSLAIDNVFAFGDSTDAAQGLSSADTDTTVVSNSYTENYPTGLYIQANKISVSNTILRNTNQSAIQILPPKGVKTDVDISNVLIKTNGNDANQNTQRGWVAFGIRASYNNINVVSVNSIFHAYSTWNQLYEPAVITYQIRGTMTARKNIYICDVNDNNYTHIVEADNSSGAGSSTNIKSDSNVFVIVRGKGFHWYAGPTNNGSNTVTSLQEWQALTGQDKHSIIIDLRTNPDGLRAVFQDPVNGNYSLTETESASRIKALGAGMTNPPLFFPQRPVVLNENFYAPGGFSSFRADETSPDQTRLNWNTYNERDFAYFVIQQSFDSTNFSQVDSVLAKKQGTNNEYQYVHQHIPSNVIFYRAKIVRSDESVFYSPVISIRSISRESLSLMVFPNPVHDVINVNHPSGRGGFVSLFNVGGDLIQTIPAVDGSSRSQMQVSNLRKGLYVVKWTAGKQSIATIIMK